jgi:hypothetical protein
MVAENDRVVARLSTAARTTVRSSESRRLERRSSTPAAFFRIENGQIAEGRVLGDVAGLLTQLGRKPF